MRLLSDSATRDNQNLDVIERGLISLPLRTSRLKVGFWAVPQIGGRMDRFVVQSFGALSNIDNQLLIQQCMICIR